MASEERAAGRTIGSLIVADEVNKSENPGSRLCQSIGIDARNPTIRPDHKGQRQSIPVAVVQRLPGLAIVPTNV
jgi:hypothetical protein